MRTLKSRRIGVDTDRARVYARRLRITASTFAALVAVAGLVTTPARPAAASAVLPVAPVGTGTVTDTGTASTAASPMTLRGSGEFSSLKVTVSQTQDLINQNVQITWSGGEPTVPSSVSYFINYLEIMQCWGDEATGPDPSQCEYGAGAVGTNPGGSYVPTSQLTYAGLVDPLETDVPANYSNNPLLYMPFVPAPSTAQTNYTRPPLTSDGAAYSNYFDNTDSNEVDFARTDANGSGNQYFQMDTIQQAPGLGCGQKVSDGPGKTTVEPCWLVVVPRGDEEVDASVKTGNTQSDSLISSPLSATNWSHRIVFPLTFEPAASSCAIGADEVEVDGDEQAAVAVKEWQPGLCAQNPTTPYSYADIGSDESRSQLASGTPGLDFVSQPLFTPPGQTAPDVSYAPVAVNALTISFYIQSQGGNTPAAASQDGVQITQINLNARLLAKLLTQSYRAGVGVIAGAPTDVPSANPLDLTSDPEFLALNPQFKDLDFASSAIPDIIVPFGNADAYSELWTWINNDTEARDFLNGQKDPWGMKVNPNYQYLQLAVEDFPTTDPWCLPPVVGIVGGPETPLCGLALHPYATSLNAGAQAASEGSQLLRTNWTQIAGSSTYDWGTTPPESNGNIAVMALADNASAQQYDLPTARLCNDDANLSNLDQDCQSPTVAGMDEALADAQPSPIAGSVLIPNPNAIYPDPDPYPLTTITYAATVPSELTSVQSAEYGNMLSYIAGPGQVSGLAPGDLAPGYAPLPSALVKQTQAVAALLQAGVPVQTSPTSPGGAVPGPLTPFQVPTLPVPSPAPTGGPAAGKVVRETLPASALAGASATTADPIGAIRYVLLGCLLAAAVAFGVGPGLLAYSRVGLGATPRPPRQRRPRPERPARRWRRGAGPGGEAEAGEPPGSPEPDHLGAD